MFPKLARSSGTIADITATIALSSVLIQSDGMKINQATALLDEIARALPPRVSVRQAYAFLLIAQGLAAGRDMTMSDLRQSGLKDSAGNPVFDDSIGRSYNIFMDEPTKDYPTPMGWMTYTLDAHDRRRKLISLTPKGKAFLEKIGVVG